MPKPTGARARSKRRLPRIEQERARLAEERLETAQFAAAKATPVVEDADEPRRVVWPDEVPDQPTPVYGAETEAEADGESDAPEPVEDDVADFAPAAKVEEDSTGDEKEVQASRYERNSAKLPRIGDDAANVVRSLESFRQSLKGS